MPNRSTPKADRADMLPGCWSALGARRSAADRSAAPGAACRPSMAGSAVAIRGEFLPGMRYVC